jgi:hypothetical protein
MSTIAPADITPGQTIRVSVTRIPSSESAAKTVRRVLLKDKALSDEKRAAKTRRVRAMRPKTRGGRPWLVRPIKAVLVKSEPGESGVVTATGDVIRDLQSVGNCVEISAA